MKARLNTPHGTVQPAGIRYARGNKKFSRYIHPMLAKLYEQPFDDDDWIYEIKWDGYRAIAEVGDGDIKLYSRNGLSFADAYPAVYEELRRIKSAVILDGEIVALDKDGKPRFQLLQQYAEDPSVPLCYYVFDCLSVNGTSTEDLPLADRKELLKKALPKSDIIRYCDHIAGQGKRFFALMQQQGLEGMIAKKKDSTYREGSRSADWLKIKNLVMEEAVIAGYTAPRGGRKYFGALILGIYKNDRLVYIGHTGTGFNNTALRELHAQLQELRTDTSPFAEKVPVNAPVTWVRPELVCNLKYTEITAEGHRRHPVFLGLRADKSANEVHEEVKATQPPQKTTAHMPADQPKLPAKVQLSHLDKVYWPDEGYTKGDLINYYNAIAPHILKYMKDRPESLLRMPNGIKDKGFFHKDAAGDAPDWVKRISLHSESAGKDINYIICNDRPTLLYLANLGCIEMNPWNSRLKHLDEPDYLVLDIDPSEHNTFEQVIDTALVIGEILDKAGAISFPKTSGATGIHIYVPLAGRYTYDQAKEFAHMVAILAQEQLPEFTSLERSLSKRGKDNIYIDYLQNRKGQTLSCAYSVRPKPGATVSTPLSWSEVKRGLHPAQFTFRNIMARIAQQGDLFTGVLGKGIDMMKCIKKLNG